MTRMRILIGLATAAALVLLFVLVRPGSDDNEATTTIMSRTATSTISTEPTVAPAPEPAAAVWQIDAREATIARKTVAQGSRVTLVVVADRSEEVHVHGYDLKRNVAPGKPATIKFRADTPGRFEIELEHAGKQIAELTVTP